MPRPERKYWQPISQPQERRKVRTEFYNTPVWRKTRKLFLRSNPLCMECKNQGRVVEAVMVDHKTRINRENPYDTQGGRFGDPLKWSNLQGLCDHHHAVKSGKEAHQKI